MVWAVSLVGLAVSLVAVVGCGGHGVGREDRCQRLVYINAKFDGADIEDLLV